MIKPTAIVTWPKNCDYPLWRVFIRKNRWRFNDVIIVFTETHDELDFSQFVKDAMRDDSCKMLTSPNIKHYQDWRNVAINHALNWVSNDWIWFTEQDFIIHDDEYWHHIYKAAEDGKKVIGYFQEARLHPCSIFMHQGVLSQTRSDFSIVVDKADHFSLIQEDLYNNNIEVIGLNACAKHLNGFSHNFRLISDGQTPNYRPYEFKKYLKDSLTQELVELDQRFVDIVKRFMSDIV